MNFELEKVSNHLKGVASLLYTLGETKGEMVWNEWALQMLAHEITSCIKKLDEISK